MPAPQPAIRDDIKLRISQRLRNAQDHVKDEHGNYKLLVAGHSLVQDFRAALERIEELENYIEQNEREKSDAGT